MRAVYTSLAAVALMLTACSKNDPAGSPDPETPKETWYLSGWTDNGMYGGSTHYLFQVHYNADSTIRQVDEFDGPSETSVLDFRQTMTYDNGLLTAVQAGRTGEALADDSRYYYKDGKLVRIDEIGGTHVFTTDSLFYNGGILATGKRFHGNGAYKLNEYTVVNGNVTEVISYEVNGSNKTLQSTLTYKYALDKPNPFKTLMKGDYFFLSQSYADLQWEYAAKNMPVYRTMSHAMSPGFVDTMHFYFKFNERQQLDSIRIVDIELSGGRDRIVYENLFGMRYKKKQ